MSQAPSQRPAEGDYVPYQAAYLARVPDGNILETLRRQSEVLLKRLRAIPDERGGDRYAAGKWTVRQVIGHMSDTERVLAYRALRIARGDATPLASFEQDDYVVNGPFESQTVAGLVEEFAAVREATLRLLEPLDAEAWNRAGTCSNHRATVHALGFVIAGHAQAHLDALAERYGL